MLGNASFLVRKENAFLWEEEKPLLLGSNPPYLGFEFSRKESVKRNFTAGDFVAIDTITFT